MSTLAGSSHAGSSSLVMVDARSISRPFQADADGRSRLKRETDDLHRQVESAFDAADWLASTAAYAVLLERWHGLLRAFATSLAPFVDAAEADLATGSRLRSLAHDLALLGRPADACPFAPFSSPMFADRAAAFGGLYVLEGSMLGGRVLAKRAADRLGSGVPTGFLTGRGTATGPLWRAFLSRLDRILVNQEAVDRAVAAARLSFVLVADRLSAR